MRSMHQLHDSVDNEQDRKRIEKTLNYQLEELGDAMREFLIVAVFPLVRPVLHILTVIVRGRA